MRPLDGTNAWYQVGVNKVGTTGIVGMYGEALSTDPLAPPPRYFFLMELQPLEDLTVISTSVTFRMWF